MSGSVLDLVLLVFVVAFAVSGYRQGLVVGICSFVGFFGGALLGTQIAPPVAGRFASAALQPVAGVIVVFAVAAIGQLLALAVGHAARRRLRARSLRVLDNLAGAAVSAIAVLLVAWMVAIPLASSSYPWLARQIRESVIVNTVDAAVPGRVRTLYGSFRQLLERGDFPEVFGPLAPTRVPPVASPDPRLLHDPVVLRDRTSVLKVVGTAPSCSRRLEGSGFVYAPHRIMTNAHVVAGVSDVAVQVGDRYATAKVVVYDPQRDVAVLRVPAMHRRPLRFGGSAGRGDSAVVAGYPLDGPFAAVSARIRGEQRVRGPDIYQQRTVVRDVYSLRAHVRSGNSGGPLLSPTGRVLGVVFAAAADDPDTGFALTAAEVAADAAAGRHATAPVSTQTCD